jgi:hypothetical protein
LPEAELSTIDHDRSGDRRATDAQIETQVRAVLGAKLASCKQLHVFAEDALYLWGGRVIDGNSVDPIILAEGARSTKSYAAVLRLVASGFGPQGSMLDRSLFEGMAIAHWAHTHPDRAIELFTKHGRQTELLWGDAFEKADPGDPRTIDRGTEDERAELADLFGRYGPHLWTGHRSLHKLLPEIEDQWPGGPAARSAVVVLPGGAPRQQPSATQHGAQSERQGQPLGGMAEPGRRTVGPPPRPSVDRRLVVL